MSPLLDGYQHLFLPRLRDRQTVSITSPLNYGILSRLRGRNGEPPFDAIWVHGYATVNAMHGMLAATLLGIPVLLHSDSWLHDRPRGELKLALKSAFFAGLAKLVDGVFADWHAERRILAALLWRTKYRSFACPMRSIIFSLQNGRKRRKCGVLSLQGELALDPRKPVILFASKLQKRKHCDHLVEAYARLSPGPGQEPNAYLVIVGDGEERSPLEHQVAASGPQRSALLRIPQSVGTAALLRIWRRSLCCPRGMTPWGMIVNEAMNARRPAIISDDVGCGPDLIENGVNGFIYPVGDVDALTCALRRVIETPGAARRDGRTRLPAHCGVELRGRYSGPTTGAAARHPRVRGASIMRLLHIVSSLDPRFGGTTEAVSGMLLYGPDGYENEVVSLDDPASPFLRETGFTVHALGPTAGYCYTPRLIPWLKANRDRFDGVVLHGMWQYCGYAVRRTMRGRVPYMVFPHGMLDPYFKRAFPAKHLKKWLYWLAAEYWVLRDARRVLFTCAAEAELAKQSFALHRWYPSVASIGAVPPSGDPAAQRETFFNLYPHVRGQAISAFSGAHRSQEGLRPADRFVREDRASATSNWSS